MSFKDLRIGWRQLLGDPGTSAVILLGLAAAVAVAYLIGAMTWAMLTMDHDVPARDRVVALEFKGNFPGQRHEWVGVSPYVLRPALRDAGAPVTAVSRVSSIDPTSVRAGDRVVAVSLTLADPDIADIFALRATEGDLKATLARPDGIALTPAAAERIFGSTAVLGRTLRINGRTLTVGALLPQRLRRDSLVHFEALAAITGEAGIRNENLLKTWLQLNGRVYARLAPGAQAEALGALAQDLMDRSADMKELPPEWTANGRQAAFLRATPLDRHALHGAGSESRRLTMSVLGAAAVLMLLLAAVNYVNLTSVRTLRRQREIGVRKSLGASPQRLLAQFLGESVLVALLAGGLGLVLAWLLAPALADLLKQPLAQGLFTPGRVALALGGSALLGLATGVYPAWVALRVNCAESLAGRNHSESAGGRWMRRALTAAQFGAAVALSALSVVVLWQAHHGATLPLGFTRDQLLAVDLPRSGGEAELAAAARLRDALRRQPGVAGVASGNDVMGRNWSHLNTTLETDRGSVTLRGVLVNAELFALQDIPLLAGRVHPDMDSETDHSVVLDRRGAQVLGFANPQDAIGRSVGRERPRTVVAVVENVRVENARAQVQPKIFFLRKAVGGALILRGSDMAALRRAVDATWPQVYPDVLPRMETVAHYIAENYAEDRRTGLLIAAASVLALLLAGFGVYALAAYTVRQRTREIVIRKLHGAGKATIAGLLAAEFARLLAVGVVLGLPLAWLASREFLGRFVDQAPVGPWPFVLAPLVALALTALATLRHTLGALSLRPTLALQG